MSKVTLAPRRGQNGELINHPVLTDGEPVIGVGEVTIVSDEIGGYVILYINNQSGHYQPSDERFEVAKGVFENYGINLYF